MNRFAFFLANTVSATTGYQAHKYFNAMDLNDDGQIDAAEATTTKQKLNPSLLVTKKEGEGFIEKRDDNQDDVLTKDEVEDVKDFVVHKSGATLEPEVMEHYKEN